ncbi:MAG: class I SAM-dependent methyltransferase [Deltaproteobacteria bacterium]|nr:class I SAM-dependent methyltransferase [Deltaproteobacteria bacterium]
MPTTEARYQAFVANCAEAVEGGLELWDDGLDPLVLGRLEAGKRRAGRVLVAGCGTGRGIAELASMGYEPWAFDVSASMVALCRARHRLSSERCFVAAAADLPRVLGARRFDWVLALGLVSGGLWLDPGCVVRQLAGLADALAPRGKLLLDFLDGGPGESGHLAVFDYPLPDGRKLPGCCFWPSRTQVLRDLDRVGLRTLLTALSHNQAEPLWLAEATRVEA